MVSTAAIKKGTGLDDIIKTYQPGQVGESRKISSADQPTFSKLLPRYARFLDWVEQVGMSTSYEQQLRREERYLQRHVPNILEPNMINAFLQLTIAQEAHSEYLHGTGRFISQLLQNSYNAGHHEFVLNTKLLPELGSVGANVKGTKDNPLRLKIEGDGGSWCGVRSTYVHIEMDAAGLSCGGNAQHSEFYIHGDVNEDLGYIPSEDGMGGFCASDCLFVVKGTMADIKKKAKIAFTDNCTFKVYNLDTAHLLRCYASKSNTIIYVHPDGKERVIS